jgi:hypothetical protein
MAISAEDVAKVARAIAKAQGHPDPEGFAAKAAGHLAVEKEKPAPSVAPAPKRKSKH